MSKINFCGMPHLASKSHRAGRLRESNVAQRSTYAVYVGLPNYRLRWAKLHRVRILSLVERLGVNPLCSCLLQASRVGLIREHLNMNTLPGTESRVIPRQFLHSDLQPSLIDRNNYALASLLWNCRRFSNLSELLFQEFHGF